MAGDGARTRRRSRGLGCGAAAIVMTLVLSIAGGASATIYVLASGTGPIIAPFLPAQSGSIAWNRHDPLTVLLLGADTGSGSYSPTSSLMVASYVPATERLTLLSIPGNLWVTVPGFGQSQISQAYADGGSRLALLTAESVTQVAIPYYLVTDSPATTKVINTLGDLTLNVPRQAASAISTAEPNTSNASGIRRLDAGGVLVYLSPLDRSSAGEMDRIQREQRVLLAVLRQDLSPDTNFRIPTLVDSLGNSVTSNFPMSEIPELALDLGSVPTTHVRFATIGPHDGTASTYVADGTDVLLPDLPGVSSLCHHLFPSPGLSSDGAVTVLNGSGALGVAASLAGWLRQAQVHVREVGSASSFDFTTTQVQIAPGSTSSNEYLARMLASLLQAPVVTRRLPMTEAPIVVLIGRDYQDIVQQ